MLYDTHIGPPSTMKKSHSHQLPRYYINNPTLSTYLHEAIDDEISTSLETRRKPYDGNESHVVAAATHKCR